MDTQLLIWYNHHYIDSKSKQIQASLDLPEWRGLTFTDGYGQH